MSSSLTLDSTPSFGTSTLHIHSSAFSTTLRKLSSFQFVCVCPPVNPHAPPAVRPLRRPHHVFRFPFASWMCLAKTQLNQGFDVIAKHIQAAKGNPEHMMWVVDRGDGGRGCGFTGGHTHKNWQDDNFRKVVLNALLWICKVDLPADGVESGVSDEDIKANLDPKKK